MAAVSTQVVSRRAGGPALFGRSTARRSASSHGVSRPGWPAPPPAGSIDDDDRQSGPSLSRTSSPAPRRYFDRSELCSDQKRRELASECSRPALRRPPNGWLSCAWTSAGTRVDPHLDPREHRHSANRTSSEACCARFKSSRSSGCGMSKVSETPSAGPLVSVLSHDRLGEPAGRGSTIRQQASCARHPTAVARWGIPIIAARRRATRSKVLESAPTGAARAVRMTRSADAPPPVQVRRSVSGWPGSAAQAQAFAPRQLAAPPVCASAVLPRRIEAGSAGTASGVQCARAWSRIESSGVCRPRTTWASGACFARATA
jgi:hypothetical protein